MRERFLDLEAVWFSNYIAQDAIEDENGLFTGERSLEMTTPGCVMASVSPPGGEIGLSSNLRYEAFGYTPDYKVKVKLFGLCPIEKEARVWLGIPAYTRPYCDNVLYLAGTYVVQGADIYICTSTIGTPETWTPGHWEIVKHNYIVKRIAPADIHNGGTMLELEAIP